MNHLNSDEYKDLINELSYRYSTLMNVLQVRTPVDKLDGAASRRYWVNPEDIRILKSTKEQRIRAIADLKTVLAQISAIK